MSDYQLTQPAEPCAVIRTLDGASIPPDPANRDYAEYLTWKDNGGVPDPMPPPINPKLDSKPARTAAQILGV